MAREIQRSALPIPAQPSFGQVTYDARDPDTRFPPVQSLRPPEGAPNLLIILLDDVGFGASSAFGGPRSTPAAERLTDGGLKYTRFHTTALCAPTRKALLTGPQPSFGGDGQHHRDRDRGAGPDVADTEHQGAVAADAEAEGGNVTLYYDGEKAGERRVDLGDDNHDHLIDPEEIVRIAFARQ